MSTLRNFTFTTLCCVVFLITGLSSTSVNIPATSVSNLLIQTALNYLNENSPNHHTYKNGDLISAQKSEESPFTIYRLNLNLEPTCDEKSVCPKEACTLEIKQHEGGAISVNRDSVQCLNLHPQSKSQVPTTDQELTDSLEKQTGDSVKLDHEVQTSADHNDRPFIAVPASKSPYCPGCPYDLNPSNLPGVSAFVDQIVRNMDESLAGDFKHTAITILRISRAVPPNANVVRYEFLLLIGETSCLKTSLVERTECSLQPNLPIKKCQVTLEEKPWQENSRVITKNNCTGSNVENELNSGVGPNLSPENTPSENNSASSVSKQEGEEDGKTEFYDQVAQEGKFSTYETMLNQYFESPTLNVTVEGEDGNIRRDVIEEPVKKEVLNKDVQQKSEIFTDRMKDFDSFLKEFDVLVRDLKPSKDDRIPVVEDIIKPVKIESGSQSEEENSKGCPKKRIESIRVKRDLGHESLVAVQDELLVKKLSRKAIAMLDDIDSDSMKRILLKVLEVKKEKTDEVAYYLKLKVATTTCNEGELDFAEERRCLEDIIYPVRICKIQLSTSDEDPLLAPKIIQSECFDSDEVKSRRRRETLVGGFTRKDVNDPKVQEYAKLGLQEYSKNLQSSYEPLIAKITEASVQVVSGLLYKIKVEFGNSNCLEGETENCQLYSDGERKVCLIKAWSQPGRNNENPKVTVDCESEVNERSNEVKSRRRRETLVGGSTHKSVTDPEVLKYAKLGLQKYSKNLQSSYEPVIAQINEATVQVVSGIIYTIKVTFGSSNCQKGETENCQLESDGELKDCAIKAWSQPWMDKNPKVTVDCEPDIDKRPVDSNSIDERSYDSNSRRVRRNVGAPEAKDVNDPEIQSIAKLGLKQYSQSLQRSNEPVIARIIEASAQVVSGMLYRIKVQFGESDCPKGETGNCQLLSDSELKECDIEAWSQPWIQTDPKITIQCEPVRNKRSLPTLAGGITPQDVTNPEIKKIAKAALKQYSRTIKSSEPVLSKIVEASVQVFYGLLYRIKVQFRKSNCISGESENCHLLADSKLIECDIEAWQPDTPRVGLPRGEPEIKITCKNKRYKRSLLGGATPMDVNDPLIQNYAQLGLKQYSQNLQSSNEPVIAKIVEASSQVVAGMLYRIKVQFGNSNCQKGETGNCQLLSDSELNECEVKAWSRLWINKGEPEITVTCGTERKKRSLPADDDLEYYNDFDDSPVNIDDPRIQNYAKLGLKKYSETIESPYEPIIVKITDALNDLGGTGYYKIKAKIGNSNCKKGKTDNCKLQSDPKLRDIKDCIIIVTPQPWLGIGHKKVGFRCKSPRYKRSLRGQNYSQKMLKQAEEIAEQTIDQSEREDLQEENYSQKMLKQVEEFKEEQMKDLFSEERSLRGQNYNQKMLKLAGEIQDESLEAEQRFRDFVQEFGRVYPNDEEKQKRLEIFRENLKKIEELNRYEQGTGEYGVTNFADLTNEEFKSNHLGLRPELKSENEIPFPMAEIPDVSLPTEFDWRKENAVTEVKDQGFCGSCWAFSVTGNIEGQYAIKHGKLLSFSEQELVDCDKLDEGCNGGLPDSAYRAIEKLGGLETEGDYPYDAEDETCHFSKSKVKVKVVSAVNITSNETEMAKWLVQNGPISIGINANAMQFYVGGISHPPKFLCNPKDLDHGVLIVGFGVHTYPIFKKTLPFWIIKNSWGPRWGERGYYRIYRGGSTCGVNQMASSAVVA